MTNEPTELTREDIDSFFENLLTSDIPILCCIGCDKRFLQNYDYYLCDECYFAQFPKKEVKEYFESVLEDMLGEAPCE